MSELGPVGRLGRYTADHFRATVIVWIVLAIGLGMLAPKAETALSGAGWHASGSESVKARDVAQRDFAGNSSSALIVAVHSPDKTFGDPAFSQSIANATRVLRANSDVAAVVPPRPRLSVSRDGHTAIIRATAAKDPNQMVRAADDLKQPVSKAGVDGVATNLTGASGMWSGFNEANKTAMMKSELISWPVTLAILVLAFGSLIAAGLPLMLTIIGLMSAAGALYISTRFTPVSIWAMNFALMFALALGIDYALFVVGRFRAALFGGQESPVEAAGEAMDTAGKAVLFSGVTVLISLSAVMLVPSPAFRSMALGIMLSVIFVLAATLTLLPAVLAKLGPRVNKLSLPWVHGGEHRSKRFAAWGERLWKHPWRFGLPALAILVALSIPVLGLRTGMPSIKVVPPGDSARQGYEQIQAAFGAGAPGALQIVAPAGETAATVRTLEANKGIAMVTAPVGGGGNYTIVEAVPTQDPSDPAVGDTIDQLRSALPAGALIGGTVAENHDLEAALAGKTMLVMAVVLALGFMLLLVALQAPLIAALGVLTNLLATGAAFGVGKLIFQDGFMHSLLGFEPQGFMNAWAPVFFFAMIFAIAMDYTVFLLSSAKEHWDRSQDPHEAMVGGLAHSGRVIFAAAAVMVAVFFTFALSGPLPPKEMGIILGVAVLLDAALVRLVLIPVLLRLSGSAAWWLPSWIDRWLPDVRFGH